MSFGFLVNYNPGKTTYALLGVFCLLLLYERLLTVPQVAAKAKVEEAAEMKHSPGQLLLRYISK